MAGVQQEAFANLFYIILALSAVIIILAVVLAINTVALRRLKRNYDAFMLSENSEGVSIERMLAEYLRESRSIANVYDSLARRTAELERRMAYCFQKVGIIRYNPFDEVGGDFSYVIALLDETNSGIVLNGIYNRSGSYTYAKDIINGTSVNYKLSYEELKALEMAMNDGHGSKHA